MKPARKEQHKWGRIFKDSSPLSFQARKKHRNLICYILQTDKPQAWIWKASPVEEHY